MASWRFKKPNLGLAKILSSSPTRWWPWFLGGMAAVFILVLIFDAWIFSEFSLKWQARPAEEGGGIVALRRDALKRVFEKVQAEKKLFEEYKKGIQVEDPS